MSEKYLVNICRTSYAHHEFEVMADSEEEARQKAMEMAGNYPFIELSEPDYSVENICTAKQWQAALDRDRRYREFQAKRKEFQNDLPTGWEIRTYLPESADVAPPDTAIVQVDSGDREYGVYVCKRRNGSLYVATEHYVTTAADPIQHREVNVSGDIEDAMNTIVTWAKDISQTGYPK